jgi:SET domain-containing protein
MERPGVVVKPSPIQGLGIFATHDFRAGDLILKRDESREVTPDRPLRPELGEFRRHCDDLAGGRVVLLGYPERHLNHCCDPSVYVRFLDGQGYLCARRDIRAGEELTNDYCINGFDDEVWSCACGHARCRRLIHVNFFEEPLALQVAYLPLLADWFIAEHPREVAALRQAAAQYEQ